MPVRTIASVAEWTSESFRPESDKPWRQEGNPFPQWRSSGQILNRFPAVVFRRRFSAEKPSGVLPTMP